jgi:hypothetical protein
VPEQNVPGQNDEHGKPGWITRRQPPAFQHNLIAAGLEELEGRKGVFHRIGRNFEI